MARATRETLPFKPSMDRANVIRDSWAYDPTELLIDEEEARSLSEAEGASWPARVGLAGLAFLVLCSLAAPIVAGGTMTGLMLAGVFAGWALFGLANYLAYRMGERVWLSPDASSRVVVGCLFLCLTSVVAAFAS